MAKTKDDLLEAETKKYLTEYLDKMKERFTVGKGIVEDRMHFNGCVIEIRPEEEANIAMNEYIERLSPIELSSNRKKDA